MKEKTQHYLVQVDRPDLLEVGHPIVSETSSVIGFVFDIYFDGRAEVMLFQSTSLEFKENMENLEEEVDEVYEQFEIAMVKATENMKGMWRNILNLHEQQNNE